MFSGHVKIIQTRYKVLMKVLFPSLRPSHTFDSSLYATLG